MTSFVNYGDHRKASQQRDWDLFQILPPDQDNDLVEDQICYQVIVKTLKVTKTEDDTYAS